MRSQTRSVVAMIFAGMCAAESFAQGGVTIATDGSVQVPAHTVPLSSFLTPEGKDYVAEHLRNMLRPEMLVQEGGIPPLLAGYLARQREVFAVERRDTTIGGVHAFEYLPKEGVTARNRDRVLINLHGGGFSGCWPGCAELESIPLAALGKIRVVSLDYRQAPKYRFPAASEDVAAAYRELLKTYRAENIGIYGCSAGGMLTGMAVAWFQKHSLPAPGAIGVLCAGLTLTSNGFGGDSAFTTAAIGESRPPPSPPSGEPPPRSPLDYFAGVSLDDPLASPAKLAGGAREVPADACRDGHARVRAELRGVLSFVAREARCRCRSACVGRHVSRFLLQRRRARVARLLRCDRQVFRSAPWR